METVEFIKQNGLAALTDQLAIKVVQHPTLPLVVCSYSQIDSPKMHDVVRECRGLVLDTRDFSVVSYGFRRFYNWGEDLEGMAAFNWSNCAATVKEDGTFVSLYRFEGQWVMSTRGTFGDGPVGQVSMTWEQLFCNALGVANLQEIPVLFEEPPTFIFELCSIFNKVVRNYPKTKAYLIGARHPDGEEFTNGELDNLALHMQSLNVQRPETWYFKSSAEVDDFLRMKEEEDATFEGVVIRDDNNIRFKCKTQTYLAYHHMAGNGAGFLPKYLAPIILANEDAEMLAIFPEAKEIVDGVRTKMEMAYEELMQTWRDCHAIESQKDFALAVQGRTRFTGFLFSNRRDGGGEKELIQMWRGGAETIVKVLFK